MKVGIQNIKEAVLFVCKFTEGLVKTLEDGKFKITELVNFAGAARVAPAAIKDLKELPVEYADMDDAEKAELHEYVKAEFDLPDDKVEAFVEKAIKLGHDLADLIEEGIDVFGKKPDPA